MSLHTVFTLYDCKLCISSGRPDPAEDIRPPSVREQQYNCGGGGGGGGRRKGGEGRRKGGGRGSKFTLYDSKLCIRSGRPGLAEETRPPSVNERQ